jgi:hypothetical protein
MSEYGIQIKWFQANQEYASKTVALTAEQAQELYKILSSKIDEYKKGNL